MINILETIKIQGHDLDPNEKLTFTIKGSGQKLNLKTILESHKNDY